MIRSVLSIGKNKAMNYLIKTVLANLYKLIIVEDVFLGMHLLKQIKNIDLAIIDLDNQTKESIDLILHINSSKIFNIQIIALCSVENKQADTIAIADQVYASLIKPFNPIELLNRINKLNSPSYLS